MKITTMRAKLMVLFLPFFIVSFGILSGVSYYVSQQALDKSLNETAAAVSADYGARAGAQISELVLQLEGLVQMPSLEAGTDRAQIIADMAAAQTRIGKFQTIFYVKPDGNGFRSNGTDGNYRERAYIKQVLTTGKPYISEMIVSRTTGRASVMIAVPLLAQNQVAAVIAGSFPLDNLTDAIRELKFLDSGYGFIADDRGLILAHPNNEELVGKLNLLEKQIHTEVELKEHELDDALIRLVRTSADEGKPVQGTYTFNGSQLLSAVSPIDLPGGQRWVMLVTAPEEEADAPIATLNRTLLSAAIVLILLAAVVIVMLSGRIAKPVTVLRDDCMALTQGDLRGQDREIRSQDEIGQLERGFAEMRSVLRTLVSRILHQSEQLAASSEELTAGAQQSAQASGQVANSIAEIAAGTEKQAVSANRITGVAQDMSRKAEAISGAAQEVAVVTESTASEAEQGRQAVDRIIQQMNEISKGSAAIQTAIAELSQGSREIGEIVTLISTIAGQTNLLALNAAIEAARAGEQGRGFAVVAEEVRKLAEQSNQAAGQIGALIERNQVNIDQAVAASGTGAAGIEAGIGLTNAAGDTFAKIVTSILRLSGQIKEIAQAIQQMTTGTRELVSSIEEIDQISKNSAVEVQAVSAATEEQSASMEEIASSSQSLATLATELREAVVKFRV